MKPTDLIFFVAIFFAHFVAGQSPSSDSYLEKRWRYVATQMPAEWYGSAEAKMVAENVLLCQKDMGGWVKNKPYHHQFSEEERAQFKEAKASPGGTFDNGATITEMRFLAKVHSSFNEIRYKQAFEKGLDYIFLSQYENGGWPQFFPVRERVPYSGCITYNDNAMVNVMEMLHDLIIHCEDFSSLQLSNEITAKAIIAFRKGIDCILKTQIIIDGKPTVWCAQHDEKTLKPAKARKYELESFSGAESVNIVKLLMRVEQPSNDIVEAVNGAVNWFENHKIEGIRIDRVLDENGQRDRVVVEDEDAGPLWARFYDLETGAPFFCGRDGIKRNTMAEISHERRNGYSWYTKAPAELLAQYSDWEKRISQEGAKEAVASGVYKWKDQTEEAESSGIILKGKSPHFDQLMIEAVTQKPGAKFAKELAVDDMEACIIVKAGKMKVSMDGRSEILKPESVILLMPQQACSIEGVGDDKLSYYLMRYSAKKKMDLARGHSSGGSLVLNVDSLSFKRSLRGGGRAYFDRPTAMCERFEMHVTMLNQKGPSHKPHAHAESEIILVLSGETEMTIDGKEYKAEAGDLYFMESELFHGVRNATDEACMYFAFKWK